MISDTHLRLLLAGHAHAGPVQLDRLELPGVPRVEGVSTARCVDTPPDTMCYEIRNPDRQPVAVRASRLTAVVDLSDGQQVVGFVYRQTRQINSPLDLLRAPVDENDEANDYIVITQPNGAEAPWPAGSVIYRREQPEQYAQLLRLLRGAYEQSRA